ncbi:DsbE family thiol:disulfide interchange protein [Legionella hackeliae]|uniref:Thiol:disulfide interchange protein DsbE n=1 Tax=Legionella hackeliae TaxID=449 RepID=A0A0A8UNK8_LEGHA|nr:DsbE family thiol:disulfide interchange protein [Legionella hackeliae]KTD08917.1 cytochrome C biogenesis protein [Legionella hackeliae]CEK10348.1 Thiol:disulfide interchange protein DsbE [Legionella hackeliae]STX47079.1 cytochrome c biogenesis protein CcmG, thiol-disulfide interchange protein DsbE [Legionella hackeliae]
MKLWRLAPLFAFVLLVVFLWRGLSLEPQTLPSAKIGQSLPAFQLTMLGSEQLFSPQILQGQVSLLNVWASWCSACIDEQVFLMQLYREGVPIYGLNYKDDTKNATQWLKEWGNPYRAIGEDHEGTVAIDLGVYGAPETFLIDKNGVIRFRHVGILDEKSWKTEFLPRMKLLQEEA